MYNLVFLAKRNPDLDEAEFHRRWRDEHGPLVAETLSDHLVSYQQWHRWSGDGGGGGADFDGMAILRFRTPADFEAMLSDPAYAERVAPDEATLLDLASSVLVFTDDPDTFVGPPTTIGVGHDEEE